MAESMTSDTRHMGAIRSAGDRSLSNPDSGKRPAAAKNTVSIITPARHAAKTCCPISKR